LQNGVFNKYLTVSPADMKGITVFLVTLLIGSTLTSSTLQAVEEGENTPAFNPVQDVVFILHTRINPTIGQILDIDDMSTVRNSYFSSSRRTKVLIHGGSGDRYNPTNTILYPAYLQAGDFSKFAAL
jgi:hypothetical protein